MNISPNITRKLNRGLLQVSKHSPLLLTVVGVAGLVTAGVLAARATLKLEEVIDTNEVELKWAKESVETMDAPESVVAKQIIKNVVRIGKLYWVPITLAAGSTVMVLAGHHILNQRYAGLVVAYKGLETAFANYRQRVIEQYGEEVDKDFRLGLRTETIEDENGKKKKVKVSDGVDKSEYMFDFGPHNINFSGNMEHNMFFLRGHQNIANDILRSRGQLFLSEVLDMLGFERTPASIVTGWLYDPQSPKATGDDYVEFGIDADRYEQLGYVLLDFNVDGTIFDKI